MATKLENDLGNLALKMHPDTIVTIGDSISLQARPDGSSVRILITAPKSVPILRNDAKAATNGQGKLDGSSAPAMGAAMDRVAAGDLQPSGLSDVTDHERPTFMTVWVKEHDDENGTVRLYDPEGKLRFSGDIYAAISLLMDVLGENDTVRKKAAEVEGLVRSLIEIHERHWRDFERRTEARCYWTYDAGPDWWKSACGREFVFHNNMPEDFPYRHCPYCGKKIQQEARPTNTGD